MIEVIKSVVWSPITTLNLLLIGFVIMIKMRFRTITSLHSIIRDTLMSINKNRKAFSLMCTSLGGTIGVGNAIGIAGAIIEGGPGAVFWMAIAGIIGMAVKYCEVYFSMIYNGPNNYIKIATGSSIFSLFYSLLCICVSLGMGNMAQVRASVTAVSGVFSLKSIVITFIIAIVFLKITSGGLNKIRSFSEIAVPLVSILYVLALAVILFIRREFIPGAFNDIYNRAGLFCGIKWSLINHGITNGFSKSIFSSEAGLGSAGFSHNNSDLNPVEQAKWAIIEVLIDSVICLVTSIALLTFSTELSTASESYATKGVFRLCFGQYGERFYAISIVIFAFASLLCWYYNGSQAVSYLTNNKYYLTAYRYIFAVLIVISAYINDSTVTDVSDIANGIMLMIHLCALWILVLNNKLTF